MVDKTKAKRLRTWKNWRKFLPSIGIRSNEYLEGFSRSQIHIILAAFGQAVRERTFLKTATKDLAASTIADSIRNISQTFRETGRRDPKLDEDVQAAFLLQQLQQRYRNLDPGTKQQKAIPISVLREVYKNTGTPLSLAIAQLAILAFFFAMRSCEYTKTSASEESKRTMILRV